MIISKMFLTKNFFTLLALLFFSIAAFSQSATVDLTGHAPPLAEVPSGSVFEWHLTDPNFTSSPALSGTAITAATTNTYYGVFYDATSACYSPAAKVDVVVTDCGIATLDLTNYAPGATVKWYKTREHITEVADKTQATSGTYFPFDVNGTVYTPINEVVIVIVNPSPSATISSTTPLEFCAGGNVILSANISASYLWSTGSTTQTISVTTTSSPKVKVTDANGCQSSDSAATTVTVNALPTATIAGTTAVCKDATAPNVTFTGSVGTAPYTFTYKIGSGSNLTATTTVGNSVTVAAPTGIAGSFVYTLVSVQDATCTQVQTGSATVTVNALPLATISGTTTICSGTTSVITFNGTANATVTYKIGSGADQTIVLNNLGTNTITTPTLTANSTYSLVSVASSGTPVCSQTLTGSATVTVNALSAAPTLTASTVTNTCPSVTVNLSALFTATVANGFDIVWYENNSNPPTEDAVVDPTKAATGRTYYAFFKETASTCKISSQASIGVVATPSGACCPAGYVAPTLR